MSDFIELLIVNGNKMNVHRAIIRLLKATINGCSVTIETTGGVLSEIPTRNRYEEVKQFLDCAKSENPDSCSSTRKS